MRIAYVANIRFPSERAHVVQIVSMANAFASKGHDVDLCVTTRKTHITERPEDYFGVSFLFRLIRVSIPDIVGRIHSFPRMLHRYLYALERILFACSFLFASRSKKYELVYCRDEWVLAIIVWWRPAQQVVWESHEGAHGFFARRLLRHPRVRIVVISDALRETYHRSGVPLSRMMVARGAIDDRFFAPQCTKLDARKALGIAEETRPVALYIGGFDRWKGVQTFFEAAAHAPHVAFVAVGGKPEEQDAYRADYPLVQFLGSRPYKELPQNQQAADVLVVPNTAKNAHSAEYTSPLKLFAHMTSGIPLVLSDIPSLRSVLSPEEAYFANPDDARALAQKIEEVVRDGGQAHEKALRAQGRSREYTWSRRAGSILDFVHKI